MVYDKVYFLENNYGIKKFLSLYNPNESNLVIISKEAISLNNVLTALLPNQEIIRIPRIPTNYIPPEQQFEKQIEEIVQFSNQYKNYLNFIEPPSEIIFFTFHNIFHFYVLLSELMKRLQVTFYNIIVGNDNDAFQPFDIKSIPLSYQQHFMKLKELIGFELIPFKGYNFNTLALKIFEKAKEVHDVKWREIANKFSIEKYNINKDAALIIDSPIFDGAPAGVDPEKTQNNLIPFFKKQFQKGKSFHLKPHYDERCNSISLQGTEFENKIKVLPKYLPVELIMDQYDEVYSISGFSTAIYDQFSCRIFSLSMLIDFRTYEEKQHFWNIFNIKFKKNYSLVQLDDDTIEIKRIDDSTPDKNLYQTNKIPQKEQDIVFIQSGSSLLAIIFKEKHRSNNALSENTKDELCKQIKSNCPDAIFINDTSNITHDFIIRIRKHTQLLVGQIDDLLYGNDFYRNFDIIFSSIPQLVLKLRQSGIASYYHPCAFDHRKTKQKRQEKKYAIALSGNISLLNDIEQNKINTYCHQTFSKCIVLDSKRLNNNSPLQKYVGHKFEENDTISVFSQTKIVFHMNNPKESYLNNSRLFDITGCGALLITEYNDELSQIFDINNEIVVYRSFEEGVELVRYYLKYPDDAQVIATAGQKRTLTDHTVDMRIQELAKILDKHI